MKQLQLLLGASNSTLLTVQWPFRDYFSILISNHVFQEDGSEDHESDFIRSDFDPKPYMVRGSMLFTIIIMLIIGLLFTFINIIFTVLNIAHNPVSSIVGIDGLVIWNFIAGSLKKTKKLQ